MASTHGATRNINFAAGVIQAAGGTYRGYTLQSSAGATIVLYDNASAGSGTILEVINLAAGQSSTQLYGGKGIYAANGIFATSTGTATGSIRVN